MDHAETERSPKGSSATAAAGRRARRSGRYRDARTEYAAIRELRKKNWIAAHIRERRYELGYTQQELADQVGTSYSAISRLEGGDHIPTLKVLARVFAVLDERLLIGFERLDDAEREVAPLPAAVDS